MCAHGFFMGLFQGVRVLITRKYGSESGVAYVQKVAKQGCPAGVSYLDYDDLYACLELFLPRSSVTCSGSINQNPQF